MSWGRWLGTALGTAAGSMIPIPGVGSRLGGMIGGYLGGRIGGGGGGGGAPAAAPMSTGIAPGAIAPAASAAPAPMAEDLNPFLDDLFNTASAPITRAYTDDILPALGSQFADAGALGGSAHALAMGDAAGRHSDALSGLAARLYGTSFENERSRMFSAEQAALDRDFRGRESALQRELMRGSKGYKGRGWGDWLRDSLLPSVIEGGATAFNTWNAGRGGGDFSTAPAGQPFMNRGLRL